MMRRLFVGGVVVCSIVGAASGVSADSAKWDWPKTKQVETNRCSNAGIGNGAERFRPELGGCIETLSTNPMTELRDDDPGVLGKPKKNANNRRF